MSTWRMARGAGPGPVKARPAAADRRPGSGPAGGPGSSGTDRSRASPPGTRTASRRAGRGGKTRASPADVALFLLPAPLADRLLREDPDAVDFHRRDPSLRGHPG